MDKNLNKEEQKKVGNLIKCSENCKSNIGYLKSFKPEDVEVYRNGNEELVIKHKEFDRIKITIGKMVIIMQILVREKGKMVVRTNSLMCAFLMLLTSLISLLNSVLMT
ncbi:hypothetical protein HQ39_06230 [Porphyromonas sp. COT-108 OH2963]|nr:hypothetical protein HQ39_06230 [Porphyromonas sp. COT-108 OH2963]